MRLLEIRRHARRERPAQHLIQRGIDMARTLGAELGPFDRVVSSPLPRCVETAVAMGFAVDEERPGLAGPDGLGESVPGLDDESDFDWDGGYAAFGHLLRDSEAFAAFAREQAAIWLAVARSIPDGGRVLIVSHGGAIEGGAVAAFPDADHAAWGRTARHCEGVLIGVENDRFVSIEVLRVPKELRKRK